MMNGHRALVTGAASGIGLAAVQRFLDEGASVVAMDLDAQALERIPVHERLAVHAGDVGDKADVSRAGHLSVEKFGGLDSIFANAGIAGSGATFLDTSVDDLTSVFRVNVVGAVLAVQLAAELMTDGGAVTLTSSVAGLRASAGSVAYSASKAAVISVAQTSATALAGAGIRVNAICPGLTRTAMTEGVFRHAEERGNQGLLGQLNPLGRAADPREIASVAVFLASTDAAYVNGQAIAVDGGLSASLPWKRWRR